MILRKTLIGGIALICIFSLGGCNQDLFTLDIVGGKEAEGASVHINGEPVGKMDKFGDGGSRFVGRLPHGTLTIEVKKQGYSPYRETITVGADEGERYVTLKLEEEKGT
ncbi:MAG TPA: PEGA domain-containing protein [Nitrospiraceae bacterium]